VFKIVYKLITSLGCAFPKCLVSWVTEFCPVALDIFRIIIAVFFKCMHMYKFTFSSRKCKITARFISYSRTLDPLYGPCFLSHFSLLELGDCS
jgi:hypothetical protein